MSFKYAVVTLNHEKIGKNPQRIENIEPYIDQCSWKVINFHAGSKDWKKFEINKNNRPYCSASTKKWWTRKNKTSLPLKTQFRA